MNKTPQVDRNGKETKAGYHGYSRLNYKTTGYHLNNRLPWLHNKTTGHHGNTRLNYKMTGYHGYKMLHKVKLQEIRFKQ